MWKQFNVVDIGFVLFILLFCMLCVVEKMLYKVLLNWWYVGRKNKSPRTGSGSGGGGLISPRTERTGCTIALRNVLRSKAGLTNLIKAQGPITNILEQKEEGAFFVSPIILTNFYLKHLINIKFHRSCALRSD